MTTLADLTQDSRNANKHTPRGLDMVQESLQKFGAGRSILVDKNGHIIAGNATAEAAGLAGMEDVVVVKTDGTKLVAVQRTDLDINDPRARELAIADNRTSEVSLTWDADVLQELAAEGVNLDQFWTEGELDALLAEVTHADGGLLDGADPDAIPGAGEVETRVKAGEVWACGPHRVACIDSTDPGAVALFLAGVTPNMVWADPPYGVNCVTNSPRLQELGYRQYDGDADTDAATQCSALCLELFACTQVWWGANYYAPGLPASRCWIVWDKDHHGMDFADAELAWVTANGPVRVFRHAWSGNDRDSEKGEKRVHPNQKPVALAEWCFDKYGGHGDVVFDPFLGSGMALIAAEKTGRTLYGCELSPEYCDVVLSRYEKATGQTATLIENVNGTPD